MKILFTTGATVTFRSLVNTVADPVFLEFLIKSGFQSVSLQYGNETDAATGTNTSKTYFSKVLAEKHLIEHFDFAIANETNDKSVTVFENKTLTLQVFGFSDDIASYISAADLVVSHAGTGSILDTLRLQKPLIVVTNDSLMDNHQAETADQFASEGYLARVSEPDLARGVLQQKISQWKNGQLVFKTFPDPPKGILEDVIATELEQI
ncbi:hypothetical protein JCM33374_g4939 [Metschnikowia sp. JCM 33374]|nr:hypothetical protein JCM33374_g4939 [Metschnikowia sp. JCM 33374]